MSDDNREHRSISADDEPRDYGAMVDVSRGVWTSRWCYERPDSDRPWVSVSDPAVMSSWEDLVSQATSIERVR